MARARKRNTTEVIETGERCHCRHAGAHIPGVLRRDPGAPTAYCQDCGHFVALTAAGAPLYCSNPVRRRRPWL